MDIVNKTRLLAINGDMLLVLEKIGPKKKLTLAGGIQKKKETLEESLVRETKEEIGLKLKIKKLKHVWSNVRKHTKELLVVKHHFLFRTKSDKFAVLETQKFKDAYWIYWEDALDYLDKSDRAAVEKYFC